MSWRKLSAADAFWRPSNAMRVLNTDLGGQLEAENMGVRLWRLRPGQASTKHRHFKEEEVYVLLEGRGRIRIGDETLDLEPLDSLLVEPPEIRQVFNDTDADALWLVVGAPREFTNTVEMDPAELARIYPDTPRTLPPELGGGEFDPDTA
jgi:quercetin dioxygenase-like cupin family protein